LADSSGATTKLELKERLAGIHRDLDALAADAARDRDARLRSLQLAARALRQADSTPQWVQLLADAAAPFANAIGFFRTDGAAVHCEAARGMDIVPDPILLNDAPAFRQAIDTKETVVSLIAESQLGKAAVGLRGRAHLFPLVGKARVLGVLLAADDTGPDVYGLEVLLSLASAALELRAVSGVALIGAAAAPAEALPSAQRFARVTVAKWILESPGLVAAGRARGDLYREMGALIDRARLAFAEHYSPGRDYLHEEILERLALGAGSMLGPGYPGASGAGNGA
jgi:hypothetical protein